VNKRIKGKKRAPSLMLALVFSNSSLRELIVALELLGQETLGEFSKIGFGGETNPP
jgi:hypothetical protein